MLRPGRDAFPRNRTVRIIAEFAPEAKSLAWHGSYKFRGNSTAFVNECALSPQKLASPAETGHSILSGINARLQSSEQ